MTVTLPQTTNYKVPDTQTLIGLVSSDEFAMQEKIDGRRLMVMKSEHGVVGYNKKYEAVDMPSWLYDTMAVLPDAPWVFDGELTPKGYYIFDLVDAPGNRADERTFDERVLMLSALLGSLGASKIHAVPMTFAPKEKLGEFLMLRAHGAEGVVFRPRAASRFFTGKLYKYKFYGTVDAIATQLRVEGKRAIEISLLKDGEYVPIGKCKVEYEIQDQMKVNSVVEVRYRKVGSGGRLVEPVFQRIRTDKSSYQCTWDQLSERLPDPDWSTTDNTTEGRVVSALGISRAEAQKLLETIL